MVSIRPQRAHKIVRERPIYAWYQRKVNIAEDRLVGPFDFFTDGQGRKIYKITEEHWTALQAWNQTVDTTNIEEKHMLK